MRCVYQGMHDVLSVTHLLSSGTDYAELSYGNMAPTFCNKTSKKLLITEKK